MKITRRMTTPTFDKGGYPSDDTLAYISDYGIWELHQYADWLEFCREAWSEYGRIRETHRRIVFITGGWSGNESIHAHMKMNPRFSFRWRASTIGGRHVWQSAAEAKAEMEKEKGI